MNFRRALMLVGVMGGLAGCATSPEDRTANHEVAVPEAWEALGEGELAATEEGVATGWLVTFQDPVLESLVLEALVHNRDLQIAAARIEAARAGARVAGADLYPTLGANLGASRQKTNQFGGGVPIQPITFDNYNIGLSSTWELDVWGRVRDGRSAAIGELEATEADYEAARLSLAAQVARLWFDYIEIEAQLELAEERLQTFESNELLVQRQFERGLSSALDYRLIRSQTLSARSLLEQNRINRDIIVRTLETVLGRYPANQIETVEQLPTIEGAVPVGLPSRLLNRRPDIRSAERRLSAAEREVSATKKLRLPTFSLTATGGTASNELEDVVDPDFSVWSLAGNVTAPIFQGGRIQGQVDQREALYEQQIYRYENTLLTAFREVENALATEAYLRNQEQHLAGAAEESIRAEELAWDRYQRGLVGIITVIESQRRSFDAQTNLLTVSKARLQNRVDLHLALGGDFLDPLDSETTTAEVDADQISEPLVSNG